jgi:hypothetical protein
MLERPGDLASHSYIENELKILRALSANLGLSCIPRFYDDESLQNSKLIIKMEYIQYSVEEYLALPKKEGKLTLVQIGQ